MVPTSTPFEQVLKALRAEHTAFPAQYLHRFSDLHGEDLKLFQESWQPLSKARKLSLLNDLIDLSEVETLVCFDEIGKIALHEPDPAIRLAAIYLLAISEDPHLIPVLIEILKKDPDTETRASAAKALGRYVYMGEVEDISEEKYRSIQKALLSVLDVREESTVQRKALEAISYSGMEQVARLIENAYRNPAVEWKVSALISMGLSADERWSKQVLKDISSPNADIQSAAITAAGELGLKAARAPILKLIDAGLSDPYMRSAATRALANIGGENVRETLEELLANVDDDEEALLIENALEELEFTDSFTPDRMFEFDVQEEDDLDNIVDLESDEDES
jgi:HEAT repeat protein